MTPDSALVRLIVAIAVLNGVHSIDHVIRGDFQWPIDGQSIGFVLVVAAIYLVIGIGLWFYRRGLVGPLVWSGVGLAGLVFGWLSHFSPFTDQPVHVIYGAYHAPLGGATAVACLIALMALVFATTLYSTYLWYHLRTGSTPRPVTG